MMKWKVSGQKNGVLLMFEVACLYGLDNAKCQIVTLIVPYQDQAHELVRIFILLRNLGNAKMFYLIYLAIKIFY